MEASALIPVPDPIPVPWGWFEVLLILTFVLHLILMNLMLGGGLLTFFHLIRGGAPPRETRALPILIALTINLGVPPLLFLQVLFGHLFYTSSVLMAVWWISAIPVLIAAYYAAYGFVRHGSHNSGWAKVWLGTSSLLLLAIGFLLTNNTTLMLHPERWSGYFANPGGTILNLSDPTLLPRYLHFVTASIAVAGLGRAVYHAIAARRRDAGDLTAERNAAIGSGLKIFARATMVQIVLGILFWLTLPTAIGKLFLGGGLVHTLYLWLAILLTFVAIVAALRGRLWLTTGTAALTIVLMVLVRDLVRAAYLAPYFHPRELEVVAQASPLVVFVLSLLAVVGVLVWVLQKAWRANAEVKR